MLKRVAPPEEVAAIFVEPIQGGGGYHVAPPNFLPGLRRLCDKYGILLVADSPERGDVPSADGTGADEFGGVRRSHEAGAHQTAEHEHVVGA